MEGGVDKLQKPVRPEHCQPLVQPVQCGAAQIDRMPELLFEPYPLGHVVEYEGQRAMRMRPRQDPDIGAIRQVPQFLVIRRLGVLEQIDKSLPPIMEIQHFGNAPVCPQAVDDLPQAGAPRQPGGVQLPHPHQRRVEHRQGLVVVEYCQADIQVGKSFGHGPDEARLPLGCRRR